MLVVYVLAKDALFDDNLQEVERANPMDREC
jgi:hypothetical protein